MSDIKIKTVSYRYAIEKYSYKWTTATISLFQHKPSLRDHLLVPRPPYFVEIIDIERNGEVLKLEAATINEAEDKYEYIAFHYIIQIWLHNNNAVSSYPYLNESDFKPWHFYPIYSNSMDGKFMIEYSCEELMYQNLSLATGIKIEKSRDYTYSIFLTERNIKLYRITRGNYLDDGTIYHKYKLQDIESFLNNSNIAIELFTFPETLRKVMIEMASLKGRPLCYGY